MIIEPAALIEAAAAHGPLVVVVMAAAAMLEAAFGVGVLFPGETVVAVGALGLTGSGLQPQAWLAVAAGAFVGDHLGYLLGRRLGPSLAESRPIRRLGLDRWHRVVVVVQHQGWWMLVLARLLPGVRTLVAAAAGATGMSYGRFALADGAAALLWSGLWVYGAATFGLVALGSAGWLVVTAVLVAGSGVAVLAVRRRRAAACLPG